MVAAASDAVETSTAPSRGRPRPRLVPPPTISSGRSRATASATMSRSSAASRGSNVVMAGSEARQVRKRDLAAADMELAHLGAAMQGREYLAGIEQRLVVERTFDALLLAQIDIVEHHRHEVALLDPDAVLAGQHAADLDAQPQDVGAERFGARQLAGLVGIEQDQGV